MSGARSSQPWYQRAVLYQVYPLSFADANGDGYGDLRGLIEHLDYLNDGTAKSLGVGAIWLSPIFRSGLADWGYDVIDHQDIDPKFGTMADFEQLLARVHERGMKLLLDYVPNHTSVQHAWFEASRSSRKNSKRDWYVWADPQPDGSPPNNWLSFFHGSAWTLDETTGQYYLHSFLPEQPDLNWRNPEVRAAMLKVLRFWIDKGVDGFRTDALLALSKDPQLRDDPPNPDYVAGVTPASEANIRLYSSNYQGSDQLLGMFCEVISEADGRFMLSETYLNIPGLARLYDACRFHPAVHAPFNFNLMELDWSAASYREFIDQYEAMLGPDDWPNYVLGNHDRPRLVSRVGIDRARLLALLQLTLRGLPVVYYGEELGLESAVLPAVARRDRGGDRDVARTPMPWRDELHGGFTTGEPWLPVPAAHAAASVSLQERQPDSSLQLYRQLIHLRQVSQALTEGTYRSIETGVDEVYGFVREASQSKCYILLNFSDDLQVVTLGRIGIWIAGTHTVEGDGQEQVEGPIKLEPYEGRLYEVRRKGA